MTTTAVQRHNYFSSSLIGAGTDQSIRAVKRELEGVEFDTFVVRGMSGAIAGGLFAHALGKNLFVIRKQEENTHDSAEGFGVMGKRWVFLDDFISSGETYKIVRDSVMTLWKDGMWHQNVRWMPRAQRWEVKKAPKPIHVGSYVYRDEMFRDAQRSIALCYDRFQ